MRRPPLPWGPASRRWTVTGGVVPGQAMTLLSRGGRPAAGGPPGAALLHQQTGEPLSVKEVHARGGTQDTGDLRGDLGLGAARRAGRQPHPAPL